MLDEKIKSLQNDIDNKQELSELIDLISNMNVAINTYKGHDAIFNNQYKQQLDCLQARYLSLLNDDKNELDLKDKNKNGSCI